MTPIEYDIIVFKEEEKMGDWDSFIHGLNSFSEDFMNQRNQPTLENRESL